MGVEGLEHSGLVVVCVVEVTSSGYSLVIGRFV